MRLRYYVGTCKGICRYNLVYRFLIQLLPLKSSVFGVHFPNAFWQGNEAFPQFSSQNEIVPLLVIFHLPYSKYRGVKIYFHSCRTRVVRLALVPHSQHSCCSCLTLVALVQLVSGTRVVNQTRSWRRIQRKVNPLFIVDVELILYVFGVHSAFCGKILTLNFCNMLTNESVTRRAVKFKRLR